MAKILEIFGLILVVIMSLSFVGIFEPYGIRNGTSEVFWACAGGALMIIIYRKMKRKEAKT